MFVYIESTKHILAKMHFRAQYQNVFLLQVPDAIYPIIMNKYRLPCKLVGSNSGVSASKLSKSYLKTLETSESIVFSAILTYMT